jgi:hypothetical protein
MQSKIINLRKDSGGAEKEIEEVKKLPSRSKTRYMRKSR